ncbi:putative tetraacyldisaccharide 4'-kinase [Parvularcula bermudensis HTCC2503]|uniref:Tetraacyldisaccharide 4'-kinase n=1 Tax=Parvularcula bermudensis (strain ATCC BAA-594 / HTCC2503 / KCTC 12087) TaxID=314260 RepID=E0TGQ9_PARBH|nr:tetraacyldisaccharide 4'-kinase [Parvularcula bermudensis]ADM10668.1 putative tetraacyldisaccharide 4'-kinase [Parvularcula bermudensis HTCC2503]
MKPPSFWQTPEGRPHPLARALLPISKVYAARVAAKIARHRPYLAGIPVICVGNVTLGGVGKTPFTASLAHRLKRRGRSPMILMRGYGGRLKGPVRVTSTHEAAEVGDEAVMLSRDWPVIIAADRPAGARLAVEAGADVIVMDDGFQNPSLRKDLSFLVVDAAAGLGNGLVFPAGPLREAAGAAMARADALVMVGDGPVPDALGEMTAPVLRARLRAIVPETLIGQRALAFCGIGRPQKFFDDLARQGVDLVATRAFADHHPYTQNDIAQLSSAAAAEEALLVTTRKDRARLSPALCADLVEVDARFDLETETPLDLLLETVLKDRS